jgi:hypothetical protein
MPEYQTIIVIEVWPEIGKPLRRYVRIQPIGVRVAMYQPIGTVCDIGPFGKRSKPLALFTGKFFFGISEPCIGHFVVDILLWIVDYSIVVTLDGHRCDGLDSFETGSRPRVVSDDVACTHDSIDFG